MDHQQGQQEENGRRYHGYEAGRYHLPNDDQEATRLHNQHCAWLAGLNGRLYTAPIGPDIQNALDIGTGTGIWAATFAAQHPQCQVIGTDLSPVKIEQTPPNLTFLVADADSDEKPWAFPPMDFIHIRLLTMGIKDWPRFFARCFGALKPGGWIEVQEFILQWRCDDGSCSSDDAGLRWSALVNEAARKTGLEPTASEKFARQLREAGFVGVEGWEEKWPIGPWRGDGGREDEIGRYMLANMSEGVVSVKAFFTRVLGWSNEDAEALFARCRVELNDPNKHMHTPASVHFARKPLGE